MPLVNEIIAVDSYSNDGTFEIIQAAVERYENVSIIQRPKGLYQSWNEGISHATQPYIYFSTIGDTITQEGLESLYSFADENELDVAVSPPEFKTTAVAADTKPWPIHDLIDHYAISKPVVIPQTLLVALNLLFLQSSLLGSSASNLYRSQALKENPFPTDFKRAGDSAWLIKQAPHIKLGILPETVSTFLLHSTEENENKKLIAPLAWNFSLLSYQAALEIECFPEKNKAFIQRIIDLGMEFPIEELEGEWRIDSDDSNAQHLLTCIEYSIKSTYYKLHFRHKKDKLWLLRYIDPSSLRLRKKREHYKACLKQILRQHKDISSLSTS